jgi:glycosyltransferase involved in cell wall biosynthesis
MKILIVSNGYPPASFGGVEVYSQDLARELRRRGHDIHVLCRDSDPSASDFTLRLGDVEGVPVTRIINDHKQSTSFQDLYADKTIHQIFCDVLDDFKPDFVHFNHLLALSATLPQETARRGIPSLIMLHDYWSICQRVNLVDRWQRICPGPRQGGDCQACLFGSAGASGGLVQFAKKMLPFHLRGWLRKMLRSMGDTTVHFDPDPLAFQKREEAFRTALFSADKVLVPSQFVKNMLVANGMEANQIEVAPLGIGFEPCKDRPAQRQTLHFAYVGSVTPLKGLETLLRAFRSVDLDSIYLDIYGREDLNSGYGRELHYLAQGDKRIVFHGPFAPDERAAIYMQMDVIVVPSVSHETFSLVAREALLCDVPVLAARVGALQELIQEGQNGFLFPPGDVDALAAVVRGIGEHPECLSMLKPPGPIEILSIPQHVDRTESMVQGLVRRKKEAQG